MLRRDPWISASDVTLEAFGKGPRTWCVGDAGGISQYQYQQVQVVFVADHSPSVHVKQCLCSGNAESSAGCSDASGCLPEDDGILAGRCLKAVWESHKKVETPVIHQHSL